MDVNADGFNDILSGCYSHSGYDFMVGSFWVFYGDKDRKFSKAVELKGTDGKTLMIHSHIDGDDDKETENICTRPFAVDWDGDGDLDIVSGNFSGGFFLFTGEGEGRFQPKAVKLKDENGESLYAGGAHSDPFVVDWDGDGDLDLLTGGYRGEIVWAENVAPSGKDNSTNVTGAPVLASFKTIIAVPEANGQTGVALGPTNSVRIHVADLNGDGKLDILAGGIVSSGGGLREDLTKEEAADAKKLGDQFEAAIKKVEAIWDEYTAEFEEAVAKAKKDGKELGDDEKTKLWEDLVAKKAEKNAELKKLETEILELVVKREKYIVPYTSGGHVWVYIQE